MQQKWFSKIFDRGVRCSWKLAGRTSSTQGTLVSFGFLQVRPQTQSSTVLTTRRNTPSLHRPTVTIYYYYYYHYYYLLLLLLYLSRTFFSCYSLTSWVNKKLFIIGHREICPLSPLSLQPALPHYLCAEDIKFPTKLHTWNKKRTHNT